MPSDLAPDKVAARLARLRACSALLNEAEARALLEAPAALPASPKSFAQAVSLRLAELRALLQLTKYLHSGRLTRRAREP